VNWVDPSGLLVERPFIPTPPVTVTAPMPAGPDPFVASLFEGLARRQSSPDDRMITRSIPDLRRDREFNAEQADGQALNEALQSMLAALAKDGCRDLFGNSATRRAGFGPSAFASTYFGGGNSHGRAIYADLTVLPDLAGVTVPLAAPSISMNGLGIAIVPTPGATTIINTYASEWREGDSTTRALIMLHELGHVYNAIPGSGGSSIASFDSPWIPGGRGRNEANDRLVIDKCLR
jgi:hypothetical protein